MNISTIRLPIRSFEQRNKVSRKNPTHMFIVLHPLLCITEKNFILCSIQTFQP